MKINHSFSFNNFNRGQVSDSIRSQLIALRQAHVQSQQLQAQQQAQAEQAQAEQAQAEQQLQAEQQIQAQSRKIKQLQAQVQSIDNRNMVFIYDIQKENTIIRLPLSAIFGELIIDWGDNTTTNDLIHNYITIGIYTITISSKFIDTEIGRIGLDSTAQGIQYLIAVESWGNFNTTSMQKAFASAKNLIRVPNTLPTKIKNIRGMFSDTLLFNQDISDWDVSNVSNMAMTFYCAKSFNQNLDKWDMTNVTTIDGMFLGATNFTQDTSSWKIKCRFTK